jgi:hypothetical protein
MIVKKMFVTSANELALLQKLQKRKNKIIEELENLKQNIDMTVDEGKNLESDQKVIGYMK